METNWIPWHMAIPVVAVAALGVLLVWECCWQAARPGLRTRPGRPPER